MNFGLNINNRAGSVDYERFGLKQDKILPLKKLWLSNALLLITMAIV